MKPNFARPKQNSSTSEINLSSRIWSDDGGCPFGTVPINHTCKFSCMWLIRAFRGAAVTQKRITKEYLVRQRNMPSPEEVTYDTELTTLAIVQILKNPNNNFADGGMSASLYNPHVEGQQQSACRLKIQNGSDIIQVGWRVDPTLYSDNKTRLFVDFQAGNTHCLNTLCPGFVLVSSVIPVDMAFDKISHRVYNPWEFRMYIDRDLANGNGWLLAGKYYKQIGFWPQKLFTSLASFADNVEWGGVTYSPPGVPKPPMGSSYFPIRNIAYDAYCRRLII
ncbi:PREDICTED: uncharacterized protein LOC109213939 [Nicotiana attenuata]|uniref:uncharacterized protein LOC109213939 n=1 Tax=Nicotiana attenuata TaxID=49451 RepID=UPI000904656B|nr:PREDICTED: uncharacterized protein LOC109213939 [Nicotiana attenuata]